MRPVSVAVDTRTKTPLWKLVVLYPAVTSVFMFAALTTRTGIGLVVLGLVIFAVGASTYAMSERRMLRENSGFEFHTSPDLLSPRGTSIYSRQQGCPCLRVERC